MRLAILSFVLGVAILQQQASLLALPYLLLLLLLALSMLVWSRRPNAAKLRSLNRQSSEPNLSVAPKPLRLAAWRHHARYCLQIVAAGLLGFIWASLFAQWYLSQELPHEWEQRDITVVGTIDSLPHEFAQGTRFNFAIEKVLGNTSDVTALPVKIPSKIALSWYVTPDTGIAPIGDVQPGQRWRMTVRLKRPHGNANPFGFDYEVWLLEQDLRATGSVQNAAKLMDANAPPDQSVPKKLNEFVWSVSNVVERCRAVLRDRIKQALPGSPYAGVIVALVVGDQRDVAQSDWKIFNRTGIGHLVSISGLHITMVAGMFAALMNFLWRRSFYIWDDLPLLIPAPKITALAGALMALLYVALAGFGVPAQRTLYMLMVVAIAMWTNRLTSVSHVLCVALGVVCLFDPWAVLSPGFWLSFAAVAMILFVVSGRAESLALHGHAAQDAQGHRISEIGQPQPWQSSWRDALFAAGRAQYAVTVGLVPLTMLLFGQVSLISPLANAVAIPLVSFIVTPLSLLGSILPAPFSHWVLQLAHACVAGLAYLLEYLSLRSFAVWTAPLPSFGMFVTAMVGTLWLLAPRGLPLRWLGVICWLPIVLQQSSHPESGHMTVTAFDVGQGMALLIETPQHRLLYDTGPFYLPESDGGSRVILPYLAARGITHLDHVIISHNDADHSGGALSLFDALQIDRVSSSLALDSAIVQAAPHHVRCEAGQHWSWDGIQFELLHPTQAIYDSTKWKPNARSCTLKISNGALSMLLPGDIEAIQEDELVNSIRDQLRADVLLAPHHGSGTSSTPAFLQAVQPSLAIFQLGYLNRYRHPKPIVFARYADFGVNRLRTDQSGAITLQFGTAITYSEVRQAHARYWYGR